ncbi:MAG: arginine deiminase family protein [Steroidobacteraceae bacterium]|jgi:dimethylargininase
MSYRFERALTRLPGANFANGLTSAQLGRPDLDLALIQHAAYCEALRRCGLEVRTLPPDLAHADSTFVEDTAVLSAAATIVTRPGAASRQGEVGAITQALRDWGRETECITAPGTVDGGDICQAENHFFIGVSARTNDAGAQQLGEALRAHGYTTSTIDIRDNRVLLHLKSGLAYLGDRRLLLAPELARVEEFRGYELVRVEPEESYAANCVRINAHVLVADGYPRLAAALRALGYEVVTLPISEFRKMDGGLSCLSLRF